MTDFDLSHLDALYVQSETPGIGVEERAGYLGGIGALWPSIRAKLVEQAMKLTPFPEDLDPTPAWRKRLIGHDGHRMWGICEHNWSCNTCGIGSGCSPDPCDLKTSDLGSDK